MWPTKPMTPEIPSFFFLPGNPEHRSIVGAVGGREETLRKGAALQALWGCGRDRRIRQKTLGTPRSIEESTEFRKRLARPQVHRADGRPRPSCISPGRRRPGAGNRFRDEHLMPFRGHWQPTPPWVATCYPAINIRTLNWPWRLPDKASRRLP